MKVALLLSGGMGKGAYQVGALRTIRKYLKPEDFSIISTASVGTLNGYTFCIDRMDDLEEFWREASKGDANGFISKLMSSEFVRGVIDDITSYDVKQDFYTLLLSMSFRRRELEYFNFRTIDDIDRRSLIMQASIKVPMLARPVKFDGKNYYDGASVETNPVAPVIGRDFDYAIAIYFDRNIDVYDCPGLKNKVIKLCFDDGTLVKNATMITPETTADMIERGERAAEIILSQIFKDGVDNVEKVLKNIKAYNKVISGGKKHSLSSSHMLSFINSITKHLITKKKDKDKDKNKAKEEQPKREYVVHGLSPDQFPDVEKLKAKKRKDDKVKAKRDKEKAAEKEKVKLAEEREKAKTEKQKKKEEKLTKKRSKKETTDQE